MNERINQSIKTLEKIWTMVEMLAVTSSVERYMVWSPTQTAIVNIVCILRKISTPRIGIVYQTMLFYPSLEELACDKSPVRAFNNNRSDGRHKPIYVTYRFEILISPGG